MVRDILEPFHLEQMAFGTFQMEMAEAEEQGQVMLQEEEEVPTELLEQQEVIGDLIIED